MRLTDLAKRPAVGPVAVPQRPADPDQSAARLPAILWPDDATLEPEHVSTAAPPLRARGVARSVAYGLSAALVIAAGLAAYAFLALSSRGASARGGVAATRTLLDGIDARADTVALAVAAFDLRTSMLERGQMSCLEFARGLVQVEEAWIAYNVARKLGPAALDSTRGARDNALLANVQRVERRFEASPCARP